MKKLLLLCIAGVMGASTIAQELPQPSPKSTIKQAVGLTDVTIEYSRPSVKGRTIFGGLVPYGQVWRFGANAPTQITTSTKLDFNGQELKQGTYAIFAIPTESKWKIVFNSDIKQWGAGSYDESKNVVSLEIEPKSNELTESFTIALTDVTNNSATIAVMWDKIKLEIPFTVNTEKIAQKNIAAAIEKGEDLDKVYYKAASYEFRSLNNLEKASEYIEKGLKVKETHTLYFLKAQILSKQGKKKEAIKTAQKALKIAEENGEEGWIPYIKGSIAEWEK